MRKMSVRKKPLPKLTVKQQNVHLKTTTRSCQNAMLLSVTFLVTVFSDLLLLFYLDYKLKLST